MTSAIPYYDWIKSSNMSVFLLYLQLFAEEFQERIEEDGEERAYAGSAEEVAEVMYAEIHSRIAHHYSPGEHHHREPLVAENERHEHGEGEGVGCMA